jgi:competence protein ComEA
LADLLPPLSLRSWPERLAQLRQARWLRPVGAAAGAAVLVAVAVAFLRSSAPPPRLSLPRAEPGSSAADPAGPAAPAGPVAPTSAATATVHVVGQVHSPGVYALPAGARVADAIVAAGGTSPEADLEQLNLAARVSDGERVYVPKKGELPPAAPGPAPSGPSGSGAKTVAPGGAVDLNTASAEQLDALPGVGPATSKAIVAYRSSHGRFRSVTELLEVPGIGPAKLEALRPLVRTS